MYLTRELEVMANANHMFHNRDGFKTVMER